MSLFSTAKQGSGTADNDAPVAATFVVAGASGATVAVSEPLPAAEVAALKRETSSKVISDVAKARRRAGVA